MEPRWLVSVECGPSLTPAGQCQPPTAEAVERAHVALVMLHVQGNKSRAAEILGFDRRTLYRKLKAWGGGK